MHQEELVQVLHQHIILALLVSPVTQNLAVLVLNNLIQDVLHVVQVLNHIAITILVGQHVRQVVTYNVRCVLF